MIPEISPLPSHRFAPAAGARPATPARDFGAELARAGAGGRADAAELSLHSGPPPEVLDEIGRAAERAEELAAAHRELHFSKDAATGRVVIEVRDLEGRVIRTIPPSDALAVLAGAAL